MHTLNEVYLALNHSDVVEGVCGPVVVQYRLSRVDGVHNKSPQKRTGLGELAVATLKASLANHDLQEGFVRQRITSSKN